LALVIDPRRGDPAPAADFFHALYNAVSAFNNCGYSLFSDNLISYRGDWIVNLTVMGLIVLGGIGFIVQHEVIARLRGLQKRLSLHTKIVLLTTGLPLYFLLCLLTLLLFLQALFRPVAHLGSIRQGIIFLFHGLSIPFWIPAFAGMTERPE
jgi:Trk-type K+ transport system membrane component